MSNSFYTQKELQELGLKDFGANVLISKFARIYKPEKISIGNNVRIDDFCILSGGIGITIGNYVHISSFSALYGGAGIELHDFSSVSCRVTIFSEADDPLGLSMMGVTIPNEYRGKIVQKKVILHKHSGLGPHCVVLPGANLEEGAVVGANSFLTTPKKAWTMSLGSPAKVIYKRKKNVLDLERKLYESLKNSN